jgi:GNAT superfamily N-acetyltransferase
MSTVIRRVSHSEILASPALLEEYAAECSIPQIGPINPQADIYKALEGAGLMTFFGAFEGEQLFGFASMVTTINPHYGVKLATMESLFVADEHRSGGSGIDLMAAIEEHATAEGCTAVLYSAPSGSRFADVLEKHRSYICTNEVYCRSLNA